MKRAVCLALSLLLALTPALAADGAQAFPQTEEYAGYSDVSQGDWFYPYAKLCYEVGLMGGSGGKFSPQASITVAELAAVSARVRETLTGQPIAQGKEGDPWYARYIETLAADGVTGLEAPNAAATRLQFLQMLDKVTPAEALAPINHIRALPDTTDAAVLRFYNAGVLTGTDEAGTFQGDKGLTRAEAAAMLARIARPEQRVAFTPANAAQTEFAAWLRNVDETAEELQRNCDLAGLAPETPMLVIEGVGTVEARYYLPLLNSALDMVRQAAEEQGFGDQSLWTLRWKSNGVSLGADEVAEQGVLEALLRGAMEAQRLAIPEDAYAETLTQYYKENVTIAPALEQLDVQAYEDARQADYKARLSERDW